MRLILNNMIQQATIKYRLKLTQGEVKGQIIDLEIELDELQESDISDKLIEEGYYESMGWPTDYYDILERTVVLH